MSQVLNRLTSSAIDHGATWTSTPGKSTGRPAPLTFSVKGCLAATAASTSLSDSRYRNVVGLPIQPTTSFRVPSEPALLRGTNRLVSTTVGITVTCELNRRA